jgi:transcriptional regulator with XRE-family HTH domain
MSHFGRNIKKIRTAKKISQTAFADLFNLKRGSIGAYEEGRAEAKIDTIVEIAAFFKLSIEQFVCKDLTFNEIYHITEKSQKFIDTNLQKKSEAAVPFVSLQVRSEFISKFNDQNYLSGLQSLSIPNINPKSIAFELADFDFDPLNYFIRHGDIVIALPMLNISKEIFSFNQNFLIIENNQIHLVRSASDGRNLEFRPFKPNKKNYTIKEKGIEAIYSINQFIISKSDLEINFHNQWQTIEDKLDKIIKFNGII